MNQIELEWPREEHEPVDGTGFRIGWDHAHHGLVPPAQLLLDGSPVGEGWRAARTVYAQRGRPWPASRHTRQWLALRVQAWRAGAAFDLATVTPNHLAQIETRQCPVRRTWLGGDAARGDDAPQVTRLNPHAAYAAGNLVLLSRAADQAWHGLGVADLVRRARAAEAAEAADAVGMAGAAALSAGAEAIGRHGDVEAPAAAEPASLDAAAWWRLAALRSFATPLPAADAARMPLAAMPPNRARVLNAAQALQVLLTLRLATPDWCSRMGAIARLLPAHGLRTDFNLWVGALAPRLLEAQALGRDLARALEDAWLGERVLRRWQHFVLGLGEPACEQWVRRLAAPKIGQRAAVHLSREQALDGWSMPAAAPTPAAARRLLSEAVPPPSAEPWPGVAACASPAQAPARPPALRRTARTPFAPRPRATTGPQPAAR
jgi:hypothetical protein